MICTEKRLWDEGCWWKQFQIMAEKAGKDEGVTI